MLSARQDEANKDEKLTAYCGFCYADCIPSCEELFGMVDRLDQVLEQLQFDHYAELKSAQHEEIRRLSHVLISFASDKGASLSSSMTAR